MVGKIPMGKKDLLREKLMAMVEEGKMTLKEAGKRLGISCRQVKRIKASYKKTGMSGWYTVTAEKNRIAKLTASS